MKKKELNRILGKKISEKIYHILNNEVEENIKNPMFWRENVKELCSLDHPKSKISTIDLIYIFNFFGSISIDLRDAIGLGHGRLLTLIKGNKFQKEIDLISEGNSYCAICITEETGGTDLHAIKTVATRFKSGYILNGTKKFVARLKQADKYLIFANISIIDNGLTVFLVDANTEGLKINSIDSLGLHGVSWGSLTLDNVYLSKEKRVGGEGQGFSLFSTHFTFWRCAMASVGIGAAQYALDLAKKRLINRNSFGAPIGRFTHLQQQYTEHVSKIYMSSLLVSDTAYRIENKKYSYIDSAMAKAEGIENAIQAVQWAMLIHGAYGYSIESGLEQILRDLLGLRIADGTTDVLRGQVSRGLLSEELYNLSLGNINEKQNFIRERILW